MIENVIAIYVFIDDIMIKIGHKEHVSRNFSDSEIITVALIASRYFHDNIDHTIGFVKSTKLMPSILSRSRFHPKIYLIFELIIDLFLNIADIIKRLNK